ncbi:MAG: enamine deaminase RidA (YjgF/YER057c/UK114 family) [Candidatus Azotimanducaceae bacterium]|jgi:enamine deaminase RidA (YjgF/YER057c/UK114 family)
MSIEVIVPESAKKTYDDWHFAPAVKSENLIFFSGVIGHGKTIEAEFRNAWQSLAVTLADVGLGYEDIIDTTLYLVGLQEHAGTMAKVKDEFIKAPYPASTWIGVSELIRPGAHAEIKVTARIPRSITNSH